MSHESPRNLDGSAQAGGVREYVAEVLGKRKQPLPENARSAVQDGLIAIGEAMELEFAGKWRARTTTFESAAKIVRAIPHEGEYNYLTAFLDTLESQGMTRTQATLIIKGFINSLIKSRSSYKSTGWINNEVLKTSEKTGGIKYGRGAFGNSPLVPQTPVEHQPMGFKVVPIRSRDRGRSK